jgi:hypothetical protein
MVRSRSGSVGRVAYSYFRSTARIKPRKQSV